MEKRTAQEKEKYQPSCETTVLSEVSRPEPSTRGGEGAVGLDPWKSAHLG